MVTVLAVIAVLLVLFVAGVVATRSDVELADAPPDAADLALPSGALTADDVRRVRFGVTLRGYRMSEVDALLERLAGQLEAPTEAPAEAPTEEPAVERTEQRLDAPVAAPSASGDDGAWPQPSS